MSMLQSRHDAITHTYMLINNFSYVIQCNNDTSAI